MPPLAAPSAGAASAGIAAPREQGVYSSRKPGSTKAIPERARELRRKGPKLAEIAAALETSTRTVKQYLAATARASRATREQRRAHARARPVSRQRDVSAPPFRPCHKSAPM